MPQRVLPAARALLYDPGAEGWPLETGFDVYDVPARQLEKAREADGYGQAFKQWEYTGSYRATPDGGEEPSILVLSEISTVCPAPRIVEYDTHLSGWSTFGGEWENVRPLLPPRKQRLVQRLAQADYVWRAESGSFLPANPNLAFTVQRMQVPPDHDSLGNGSYVDVVIADTALIRVSDSNTAGIYLKIGGRFQQVKRLALRARSEELVVWFTVRRNGLAISFDQGEKWEFVRGPEAISIPSGQLVVEGAACQMAFGLHQLAFDDCDYITYDLPVLEEHLGAPTVDLTDTFMPTGTAVDVYELASPPATLRYRVELTVDTFPQAGFAFDFYRVPEVYATLMTWEPAFAAPVGGFVDLVTLGVVTAIDLDEEEEISQRSGSIELLWDPADAFTGNYGWRFLALEVGYLLDDATFALTSRAGFYLIQPEPGANSNFEADVRFELADTFIRAETTIVDEGWRPLDGLSCVAARNYVLAKCGLPPTRASWYNSGLSLEAGPVEKRRWHPQPGMTAAEVYAALDLYEGVETFVASDLTWTSRPVRYTEAAVSHIFDGEGADPELRIKDVRYRAEHRESKTAVLVSGQDGRGGSFWATSINYALERTPATPGFIGFRRWQRFENQPITSLTQAILLATQRRALLQDVPQLPEVTVPGAPDLFRGFRIQCANVEQAGIGDANEFRVEALAHRWRPTLSETVTEIRGRRLV